MSETTSQDEGVVFTAAGETALAAVLFALGLAIALIMLTRSLVPALLVLLCGPLAAFLSVWVTASALSRVNRWAATVALGLALAVVFVLTLDGFVGIIALAVAATAAAIVSRRPSLAVATSAIWLELGTVLFFLD